MDAIRASKRVPRGLYAGRLIEGLNVGYLLADWGYDSEAIVVQTPARIMAVVIMPRENRKKKRAVENAFPRLQRWRGIATRYAKNSSAFEVAVPVS